MKYTWNDLEFDTLEEAYEHIASETELYGTEEQLIDLYEEIEEI